MNIDFTTGQVNEGKLWTARMNLLNQLKINFAVNTKSGMKIYGGPSIKYFMQETTDEFGSPIAVKKLSKLDVFNMTDNYYKHSVVVGVNLGIRF